MSGPPEFSTKELDHARSTATGISIFGPYTYLFPWGDNTTRLVFVHTYDINLSCLFDPCFIRNLSVPHKPQISNSTDCPNDSSALCLQLVKVMYHGHRSPSLNMLFVDVVGSPPTTIEQSTQMMGVKRSGVAINTVANVSFLLPVCLFQTWIGWRCANEQPMTLDACEAGTMTAVLLLVLPFPPRVEIWRGVWTLETTLVDRCS